MSVLAMRAASPRAQQQSGRGGCDKTTRRANHFRFTEIVSSPQNKKYFAFPEGENQGMNHTILSHQEGRSRSSRNAGQGAVDAEVPTTNGADAYGEDVWF
jgi:hypothetical protein